MAGIGNQQGGTAGGREGTAVYHLSCWKEGLTILAERGGAGDGDRKGLLEEGGLGWALKNGQETTKWASIIDSLSPGLSQQLGGVSAGGPGPLQQGKVRSLSLAANFQEENETQGGTVVAPLALAMVTGLRVASKSPVYLAFCNPFFIGLEPRRG